MAPRGIEKDIWMALAGFSTGVIVEKVGTELAKLAAREGLAMVIGYYQRIEQGTLGQTEVELPGRKRLIPFIELTAGTPWYEIAGFYFQDRTDINEIYFRSAGLTDLYYKMVIWDKRAKPTTYVVGIEKLIEPPTYRPRK